MALAPIGRRGIVNSLKKISGFNKPGTKDVADGADFMQGMAAVLGSTGKVEVADNTSKVLEGLFNNHNASAFYRPIIDEQQTFTGALSTITMAKANMRSAYEKVTNSAGSTTYVKDTDYTIDYTAGTITLKAGGSIGNTDTVKVSYLYQDTSLEALDLGGKLGKVSIIEEGEVGLLIYDTTATWAVNSKVTVDANGLVTTGGTYQLGYVTKVPSSDDPELEIQIEKVSSF